MSAGKYKEALTDYENLVNGFSSSPWAPKALLELGSYYLRIENDATNAAAYFTRIQEQYAQSEEAPAAYYEKARIVDELGENTEALEGALADLIRMVSIYPGNSWQSGAYFLMGKLCMRLKDYDQSLNYFQRLEFNYPRSPLVAQALLMSAKVAYFKERADQARLTLARLQNQFPNTPEAEMAASLLRVLDRIKAAPVYEVDRAFFGAAPKSFQTPSAVSVGWDDIVGIIDQQGAHFKSLGSAPQSFEVTSREMVDFVRDRDGVLLCVLESKISDRNGAILFENLGTDPQMKDIRAVAIDGFRRLFVVDGSGRDVFVFSRNGTLVKALGLNRPKSVRCFQSETWILNSENTAITPYDSKFRRVEGGVTGFNGIVDFQFDPLGHLYILHSKGNQVDMYDRFGAQKASINLKTSNYPLKQAQALGVDASGAIFLVDRRGGAVYRFH